MIIIELSLILVPIFIAGIFIVREDLKERVVKNNYVLTILIFGVIYQLLNGSLLEFPVRILSTFAFGALFSGFLWSLNILPAGDSKLFTSLLMYFPAEYYTQELVMDFMINIFVPIFVFISFYVIYKSKKSIAIKSLKKSFKPYRLGMVFIILIGFAWFIYSPFRIFGIDLGYFGFVILVFVGYEILLRIPSVKTEIILILLAIIRIVIDYQNALTLDFYLNSAFIVGIFVVLRFFILQLSFHLFTSRVKIKNLEPGMSPGEGIMKNKNNFSKKSLLNPSLVGYLMDKKEKFIHSIDFLDNNDIRKIRDLNENGEFEFDSIKVHEKQPFSFFVFIGFFITFVLGTNFVSYLKLLFI